MIRCSSQYRFGGNNLFRQIALVANPRLTSDNRKGILILSRLLYLGEPIHTYISIHPRILNSVIAEVRCNKLSNNKCVEHVPRSKSSLIPYTSGMPSGGEWTIESPKWEKGDVVA